MKHLKCAAAAAAFAIIGLATASPVVAQSIETSVSTEHTPSGTFVRKSKKLKGGWVVEQRGEKTVIVFDDAFVAARGPDLKIFLSPTPFEDVKGKTAVKGSINIGELKSTKGRQEYELPAGVRLSDYQSLLVHCEAYSVLWGGSDL
ncbi:MAG: DM13 domain-containing protein [Henriciella sp.]|nr:DM13 domain-containing protein [Henriciella sp.]